MRTINFFYTPRMENFNCRNDIIYLIRHLSKLLKADFDERVAKLGLTGEQARILFFVYRNSKNNLVTHQNDIEKHFSLAKSTVNGFVTRLVKNGFIIKRKTHPYAELEITQLGIDAITNIDHGRVETINKLFQGYDEEEIKNTIKRLNVLIDNLEGGIEDDT